MNLLHSYVKLEQAGPRTRGLCAFGWRFPFEEADVIRVSGWREPPV